MRTTLKRGIGRVAVVNGDGRAVLPPGVLSPVQRYRQPERVRSRWRAAGRILFVVLALCLATVAGIAGGTYLWAAESVAALSPEGAVKLAAKTLDLPPVGDLAPVNALVIGYDHRPEDGDGAPSRSDTVMLLHADPQGKTISMLSFPRDLIVEVRCPDGGASLGRINSAYAFCGPQGTLETVRNLTGVPIHYLIAVNFEGFRQTVDRLGGVWLDVDRRYYNPHGGVYSSINLWPGYQRLKGSKALDFVRYRHTDSDLFRLARQQVFVKALKQAVNSTWKPTAITKIVAAMRNNVQIGQAGGKGTDLKTLKSYGLFAYGLPSGNFVQVKIGGLTGINELSTDPANIQTAVAEFQNPDTDAPEKATAQVLHKRLKKVGSAPNPKNTSVVVLNGNGVAGSAANTSYLLSQKGYAVKSPPDGFQANAPGEWARSFRTQIFFSEARGARLAATKMVALFNSADANALPAAATGLPTLANGAMLTVVVGKNFTGRLTPTAPDRTPERQAPNVRPGKDDTLPSVRAAVAWKVGFNLQIPTVLERSSVLDSEVPYRVYKIGKSKAVRFTFRMGSNEYWGIQETDWNDAPVLDGRNFSQAIKGRQYDLYYSGPHLHMVVLRAGGASYWVVNTLLDSISNETMLEIAKGLKPLHK
jgi:LCP family protein required for cell wall assembly